MKRADIFPQKYLKGTDIEGEEILVTITDCRMEDVGGDEDKLVVRFKGASKGLVCNATNFDRIAYVSGSDDTDGWPGTKVVLYTELATFPGRPTAPAVRVKPPKPPNAANASVANPAPRDRSNDMDDEIPF
jgi:hypothetical protein